MHSCKCPASVCVREDGSEFLIFEHNEKQPMSFGDSPAISAKCVGQVSQCVQIPDQLAVTRKVRTRFVIAVGANGLEEVTSLVAVVIYSDAAG